VITGNFKHVTVITFGLLYKIIVRSHLDYCSSELARYAKWHRSNTRKGTKRATKLRVPALQHLFLQWSVESLWVDNVKLSSNHRRYYRNIENIISKVWPWCCTIHEFGAYRF